MQKQHFSDHTINTTVETKIKFARTKTTFFSLFITFLGLVFFTMVIPKSFSGFFFCVALIIVALGTFAFLYQIALGYWFGREVIHEIEKRRNRTSPYNVRFNQDSSIDTLNAFNGYGPGIGFIVAKPHRD